MCFEGFEDIFMIFWAPLSCFRLILFSCGLVVFCFWGFIRTLCRSLWGIKLTFGMDCLGQCQHVCLLLLVLCSFLRPGTHHPENIRVFIWFRHLRVQTIAGLSSNCAFWSCCTFAFVRSLSVFFCDPGPLSSWAIYQGCPKPV